MEVRDSIGLQDEYLTLLTTQLRNQDPLDPVAQEDFLGQVTQFSTLAEIEALNTTFEQMVQLQGDLLRLQEVSLGSTMVGKTVQYQQADADSSSTTLESGRVDSFEVGDAGIQLVVGANRIPVSDVISIS